MTAENNPGTGTGESGASNRWKTVAAALADARRLDLYARIITAASSGAALHRRDVAGPEGKSLAALEKAGLVSTAEDGALGADADVFVQLLAAVRKPADTSPLRLLAPGRAGGLPGRRRDRLELLHHMAGEVFSHHGSLPAGTDPQKVDPAASPAQLTEAEVTARLAEYSDDPAMVRRAMVDEGIVRRSADGSRYWLARPRPADGMEFA